MSLSSLFHHVVKDLIVAEQVAEPIVSIFNEPAAALMHTIATGVAKAEIQYSAPQSGAMKSQAVVKDFDASFAMTQDFAKNNGMLATYDADLLQKYIDAELARQKAADAFKSSWKLQKA